MRQICRDVHRHTCRLLDNAIQLCNWPLNHNALQLHLCNWPVAMILPVRPLASTRTPHQTTEQIDRSSSLFLFRFVFSFLFQLLFSTMATSTNNLAYRSFSASGALCHVCRFHSTNHCFFYVLTLHRLFPHFLHQYCLFVQTHP